jgi:NADPH:quinone reductase-like Zn-dependent oxidoreductase
MTVRTDAWVVHAGKPGAPPERAELAREVYEFEAPKPDEALVEPLFGCMEGNMGHILDRLPIDICLDRGEPRCVPGNAGVVRVVRAEPECTTVTDGDYAILFCNGQPDAFGYPQKIFGYDDPGSIGMLAKTTKLKAHQMIPIPKDTRHSLQSWAAFSLRYVTAWSNWELAYGTLRLMLDAQELPAPHVWGWGGGVTLGELVLAKHAGCKVVQIASTDERLATIEAQGITAVDRREFEALYFDRDRFRRDEAYTASYIAAENTFLDRVRGLTDGKMVSIFIDYVGAPVLRATIRATTRESVITTAGWKEGMRIELVRATECIERRQHVHTHYARYAQGAAAVAFAEEHGWLPPVDEVFGYDDVPAMFDEYAKNTLGWFPVYAVNE